MKTSDISRRSFVNSTGAAMVASVLATSAHAQQAASVQAAGAAGSSQNGQGYQIGMLLYPGLTPLDLVAPQMYLNSLPGAKVYILWKDTAPVKTAVGYDIVPTTVLKDCPRDLDVLFVPGGNPGTIAMIEDDEVLSFLADRGSRARYVTSVCTGSLILGAAGLLKGYQATSHWRYRSLLPIFGATPVEARIVTDRNRVTGGGVTAGIDFGLQIVSVLRNNALAEAMQLATEYDPHPPFNSGSPRTAPHETEDMVYKFMQPAYDQIEAAAKRTMKRRGAA